MRANLARSWLFFFALVGAAMLACHTASAQDSKSPASEKKLSSYGEESKEASKIEDKKFEIPYWDRSESFQIRAAIALIGAVKPLGVLGARMAISENVPTVQGWEFFFDKVLPINRNYLDLIRDGRPMPDMRGNELIDLKVPDRGMYLAYIQALRRSNAATLEMFQRSAEETENVVYTDLAANPKLYRGKVVTVKGKITVIRSPNEVPQMVEGDGILKLYTSWIVGPTKGAPPFAIAFTELPKELKVSESLNHEVTFHGYFLGNVLFPADKERGATTKDLVCPWLIGKTLTVDEKRATQVEVIAPTRSYEVVVYTVGAIFGVGVLIGLLNLYFRRTDQHTQSKLAQLRDKHQPFSLEDGKADDKKGTDESNPDGDWPARFGK